MIQVLQSLSDGRTVLAEVPVPGASGAALVVETRATVLSAGTERMLVEFGRAGLLDKARQQPDKVRQVLDKMRTDGIRTTVEAVRAKLDTPIALGYCNAGVVVEAGPRVERFAPGDRVVTNGPHAEYVRVPHTLAARIPDGVSFEHAAFAPVAAIGLHGLRLARPTLGETVVVYGLGLIGLLTVQLARAAGCRVIGIDRASDRVALAERWGATGIAAEEGIDVAAAVRERTGGDGADIVLLTLATDSDEPVHAAADMARKRGRLVLVGVTGLGLRRDDFYRKELSFQVSCSYGPGRYDPQHEDQGIDYPAAYVRWTEARNFAAVLDLMADGRLDPAPLVTHRFGVAEAPAAYDVIAGGGSSLAVVLTYPEKNGRPGPESRTVRLHRDGPPGAHGSATAPRIARPASRVPTLAVIGAGNFASRMLIPALAKAGAELHTIASAGGVSAAVVGAARGFRQATTDAAATLADPDIDAIVVATRHDSHADWVVRALEAGKHVFVEKPLALTEPELDRVASALEAAPAMLCVGFNRRFAPLVLDARRAMAGRSGPLAISMMVNAGALPSDHWTKDRERGGGRIVGEACHFIDLARAFVGAPIASLRVTVATSGGAPVEDVAALQLGFADGSIAVVHYLSNGHRAFPKERIELIWDGRIVSIDNFRRMRGWGVSAPRAVLPRSQDKGHEALAAAFVAAAAGRGPVPIPPDELLETSRWSIRAGALAAAGGGEA
jgi:predicted dehydrogenase/threonine dehydrogenase-like Zn-dependent dehydrogenase